MDFHERLRVDAFSSYTVPKTYLHDELNTHGWLDTKHFIKAFDQCILHTDDPFIVEVGSWKGKSACAMASHLKHSKKKGKIVCVDTWLGAPEFWTWGLEDETRGGSLNKRNGYPTVYIDTYIYDTFLAHVKSVGHDDIIAPLPLLSIQAADVLAYYTLEPDVIYIDASRGTVFVELSMHFPNITTCRLSFLVKCGPLQSRIKM